MPFKSYIHEYYHCIETGKITVGFFIKTIFEIIITNLNEGNYYFSDRLANKAIIFIEKHCHHCEGRSDLLKLELWQKAIVSCIFGIVDADDIRIFREVFIVVARKNGKSLFASAIIAYMAYIDGEYGAKIYCLAPKLEQAKIVYENFYQIIQNEPILDHITKRRRSDIYIKKYNTAIKTIAFNSKKSDGFNPQGVVCDEVQAWQGDAGLKQYEVMKSALGARKQPLILSITTAGYIDNSIYDELMKRATSFLKGTSKENRLLPFLYIIDDLDKWDNLKELEKSNPNLGVSVKKEFLLEEMEIARGSSSKKAEYLTKYCNIKQNSSLAWLEHRQVEKMMNDTYTLNDFIGCYAVGGIDLSQTTDLTAATILIEKDDIIYNFTQFFMPSELIEKAMARDGVPYDAFVKRKVLTLSGDNHVNYRDVYDWFIMLLKVYKIRVLKIGYDRYSAQYLIEDLKNTGFHTDDVFQGENLTAVLTEFEGTILDKKHVIVNNPLLAGHFLNVAMKYNTENKRFRPVKINPTDRIDGFVATADALTMRHKYHSEVGEMLKNKPKRKEVN